MRDRRAGHPRASGPALAVAALALALAPGRAAAQAHAIGPGHETTVLALFAPHGLGEEVQGGFALWGVSIEPTRIRVTVRRADGTEGGLFLQHPDDTLGDPPRSTSFAVVVDDDAPAAARPALEALIGCVQRNDAGGFWESTSVPLVSGSEGPEGGPPLSIRRAMLWGAADWVPVDGMAVVLLVFVLGLLLAARLLADAPRWIAAGLACTVVSGVAVRLLLAPPTFLGAWPWTRLYPNVAAVAQGRWLATLAQHAGERFYVTDVTLWTNFAYAAAMPLVLFSHATYLLRDPRAGLAASAAIAFLPQHIRFSRCEDGFVGSLVLTSLAFAMIHGWLRDSSRVVRGLLLAGLPLVLYPGFLLRPLNILFIAVYAVALLALHAEAAPRSRRAVGLVVVLAVGAAALVQFAARNAEVAAATVGPHVALDALWVLSSPHLLVLSDPTRTPPALIALAILGGILAWRAKERRLVAFLVGWLLLFVVAHAVVIQPTMQPRYHLHLVVPFLLLGALAVAQAPPAWWTDRRVRGLGAVLAASIVLAPWIHGAFIADTDYAELREYAFVRSVRNEVPAGCTVVEYVGGAPGDMGGGARFERIGAYASPHREGRFEVVRVHRDGLTTPAERTIAALVAEPHECLHVYDGLACATASGPEAGACARLAERLGVETVREATAPARLYDTASDPEHVLDGADHVVFRLSRRPAATPATP